MSKFHSSHRVLSLEEGYESCRHCPAGLSLGKNDNEIKAEEPCLANFQVAKLMWEELKELRYTVVGEYGGNLSQFESFEDL